MFLGILGMRIKHVFLLCFVVWVFVSLGFGQAAISVSPKTGPPTTNVLVSGSGFPAFTALTVSFDTAKLKPAMTDSAGAFSGIALQVPASALPGTHMVKATALPSSTAAQAAFLVRTDWEQFHFAAHHKGVNPFENVLSPSTVGTLKVRWTYNTGAPIYSSPAVANGVVYFGSSNHNLIAVDARTGIRRWRFTTGGAVSSSPAVVKGRVFVVSDDGYVYALNARSGALLWSFYVGGVVPIERNPAVSGGVVYISDGSYPQTIYALNASTGALLWVYPNGGGESSPAVANGVVYFGSGALNASTGALLWSGEFHEGGA